MLHLADWESFYVIVGSSAGALTGLMFVVIALGAEVARRQDDSRALRAFATPTIVHFSTVLLIAAVVSAPRHTRTSLGLCLVAIAAVLLGYVGRTIVHLRRQQSYAPLRSDWLAYILLPAVAYASVLIAGFVVWTAPSTSMWIVGGASLVLLFTGIRNAWDGAVWVITNRPDG